MNKFTITLLVLLWSSTLYAQRIDLANPDKSFKRMYSKVIGQNDRGFFIIKSTSPFNNKVNQLRLRDNRIEIAFIETSLATKWSFSVVLPDPYAELQDIRFISDSLYIFYASINKEKSANELFAVKVDLVKGGLSNSSPKKVDEIQFDKKRNRGIFYIQKSKDGNLFSTMYKQSTPENDKLSIFVKVYSKDFERVWSNQYPTEYFDGILLLNDFEVGNDSCVYILTSLDLEKKTLRDRKYSLTIATPKTNQLENIPISADRYFINDLRMELDEINQKIALVGLYSEINSTSSAGIFFANFNKEEKRIQKFTESFKAKFLNEFLGERTVNRGTELINYFIDRIVLRTDGGVILIAESNYITESTNYNSYYQLYTTSYTYHYDNILVFSINPDGKIDWEQIIRKNQVSEDDGAFYSSYILSIDADKVNFVYNKFIRKSADIMSFSVSNLGVSEEKTLAKETENLLIMPGGGKQISSDQIIIPCVQKNKTNFLRVTF